ncbi:unnamed protein product [Symbiodinium microadriaticum]|nr:unnamed protein product [Symbiodinium sp. KB8]CAE7322469.1 unnamed protein product [Symbiodinium microadriaticum]
MASMQPDPLATRCQHSPYNMRRLTGCSLEERLHGLLSRLGSEQRRRIFSRLTQAQRQKLEQCLLAKCEVQRRNWQGVTVVARSCDEERDPGRRWSPLRRGHGPSDWSRALCQPHSEKAGHAQSQGVYKRVVAGHTSYEATCRTGPFNLSTKWTRSWEAAERFAKVLKGIRKRVLQSSAEIEVSFREAIAEELWQTGLKAREDLNLAFVVRIGARYWVGRSLESPRFAASGLDLERGLSAFRRLRQARGAVFEGACNELSLLMKHSPGELSDAWQRLRMVYLDIWEQAGHSRERVARRLDSLEAKQKPRRLQALRRWRARRTQMAASRRQAWPKSGRLRGGSEALQARCERLLEQWWTKTCRKCCGGVGQPTAQKKAKITGCGMTPVGVCM